MNVSDYGLAMRSKAIGMIESGVPKKEVAKRLNVDIVRFEDGHNPIIREFHWKPRGGLDVRRF